MCGCTAALKMKSGPSNGKVYTEEDWNTDSEPDKEGGYMYSKVLGLHHGAIGVIPAACICTVSIHWSAAQVTILGIVMLCCAM